MRFVIPHSAFRIPHSKHSAFRIQLSRRGGTYIIVVGSALVVSSLGMMAILQQRIQRKGFESTADMEQARLNAVSAVRLGLLQVARDPNWRSAAAAQGGEVLTLSSADFGNVVLEASDAHDADLTDDANDPVLFRAATDVGGTTQYAEWLLHPTRQPPEALFKGLVAGDDVTATGATVRCERPLSCDTSTLASANLYADVEAVATSGSTYHGGQTIVLDKNRPPVPDMALMLAEYTSRGTSINIGSVPPNSPNLVRNSGIESGDGNGDDADHWFPAPSPPDTGTCDVEQDSGPDHSGTYSLRVTNRTAHTAGPVQFCTDWVKPNTTYYLEAWINSDELLGLTEFRFSWHTDGTASAPQWKGAGALLLNLLDLGAWKKLSATITTDAWAGDLQSSYIKIESTGLWGPPDFYLDDFVVQEVNARFLYRHVLSPSSNPFGATNPNGVYVVDCVGSRLVIERCRILGTLVVLNPGPGSMISGPMSWEPAVLGYPSLIVGSDNSSYPADIKIATSRRGLSEARNATNYNPAGTPHDAVGTDSDQNDTLPSEIRGWMYAGRTLTFDNAPTIHGVVMASEDIQFSGAPQIFWDAAPVFHAPPGLEGTLELKTRPGAIKKAVQ
jgi:hypothetical protein